MRVITSGQIIELELPDASSAGKAGKDYGLHPRINADLYNAESEMSGYWGWFECGTCHAIGYARARQWIGTCKTCHPRMENKGD